MREVIGVDMYNQVITGKIAKTFTAGRVDTHNIPCVLIAGEEDEND